MSDDDGKGKRKGKGKGKGKMPEDEGKGKGKGKMKGKGKGGKGKDKGKAKGKWRPKFVPQEAPPPTSFVETPGAVHKQGYVGFLGDVYTPEDAKILGLGDSWYYTWMTTPEAKNPLKAEPGTLGLEFVPMCWGKQESMEATMENGMFGWGGGWNKLEKTWKHCNVHFLLGYNEPDQKSQANLTPEEAAANWVVVQEIAKKFDLELVSPAVSEDAIDKEGNSEWLDKFFAAGENVEGFDASQIKYIAFHDYSGDVRVMKKRIQGLRRKYHRKIWITELSVSTVKTGWPKEEDMNNEHKGGPTEAQQIEYMKEALPMLEANESVYRYAWFAGRCQPGTFYGLSTLLPYAAKQNDVEVDVSVPNKLGLTYRDVGKEIREGRSI